jgi:hypothetical protein
MTAPHQRIRPWSVIGLVVLILTASACGSGDGGSTSAKKTAASSTTSSDAPVPAESNPPGDIPDNLAFVRYTNKAGGYSFTHPEGWARAVKGVSVLFTDKLNGVAVTAKPETSTPTVSHARGVDIPRLKSTETAFQLRGVSAVKLPGGSGVRIVFRRNSEPDSVTGKVYRDEVEEYIILSSKHVIRMDLFGPVGADNVDAYRTMSRSLTSR